MRDRVVVSTAGRLQIAAFDLAGDVTGQLQAGVGAGDREADDRLAVDGDRADLDVFRGGRALLRGKIGGLRARDGDDTGRRTEQ